MELPKKYNPKEAEKKWQQFWQEENIYGFNPQSGKPVYSIDTPPPTVSGKMHIGHAFSYAHGDFIVRFHRMLGKEVFYPFGTDDNGLPTEKLVEKTKKVQSKRMEKKPFRELCLTTVNELKPEFIRPWKELGISADFEHSYSTIDEHSQKTSQLSFLDLYKKGYLYRKETPTVWCPTCQTAIAQAEFENVELSSTFNDILFKVDGQDLIISTTRPELLPACVAVFVHPDDERYKHLVGKTATVPHFNHEVPILADEKADPEKGSGAVMCCTFGDKTDVEWWYQYNLPLKITITPDGKLNELGKEFAGLPLKEARQKIIEALKEEGLLVGQKPITHAVNVHERCHTEIEFLNTTQWFIDIMNHKDELIAQADKINWYPEHMKVRYVHWVKNLSWDWCISRQRHYGVPFPVWYCKDCGEIILAQEEQLPVDPLKDKPPVEQCPKCGHTSFIPEEDVMDTWATSSLTPQIALNWANDKDMPQYFNDMFPMTLRLQAHDIIRTWAFYTIVKAYYHQKDVPWKNIMISGHALDPKGKKMSKSKGNVVDPLAMMEKYNADALRYWAAGSKLGDDLPFQEKDLVTGNKTITKLFNAAKFTIMHLEDYQPSAFQPEELEPIDQWLLAKYAEVVKNVTLSLKQYEYARAKQEVDVFFWHVYCDNYLEIVKGRLYNPDVFGEDKRRSAQHTLYTVLLGIIKMFAPFMPHITEEIYQWYFRDHEGIKSIHITQWPEFFYKEETQKAMGDLFVAILSAVRKWKSSQNMSLGTELGHLTISLKEKAKALQPALEQALQDLKNAAKVKEISFEAVTEAQLDEEDFALHIEQ